MSVLIPPNDALSESPRARHRRSNSARVPERLPSIRAVARRVSKGRGRIVGILQFERELVGADIDGRGTCEPDQIGATRGTEPELAGRERRVISVVDGWRGGRTVRGLSIPELVERSCFRRREAPGGRVGAAARHAQNARIGGGIVTTRSGVVEVSIVHAGEVLVACADRRHSAVVCFASGIGPPVSRFITICGYIAPVVNEDQLIAGAPARIPSKSPGYACASMRPCRPPVEQPSQYAYAALAVVARSERLGLGRHFMTGALGEISPQRRVDRAVGIHRKRAVGHRVPASDVTVTACSEAAANPALTSPIARVEPYAPPPAQPAPPFA